MLFGFAAAGIGKAWISLPAEQVNIAEIAAPGHSAAVEWILLGAGGVFAGLISAQALFPYALDKWFGLNGTWFLLFGGVLLLFTLIQNPEGVAGSFYRTAQARARRKDERAPSTAPVSGS